MSENRTVYRRIAEIQIELMGMKIPKTGYNRFNKHKYHELEDLIPPILKECFKRELMLDFTFTSDEAILKVRDLNTPADMASTRLPMPKISELNGGMNVAQSEGAVITYFKRYLLINMFLIMEKDVIDAEIEEPEEKKESAKRVAPKRETQPKRSKPAPNNGRPVGEKVTGEVKSPNSLVDSVVEYCKNIKKEATPHNINLSANGMKRKGLITETELKKVHEFTNKLQEKDIVVVA